MTLSNVINTVKNTEVRIFIVDEDGVDVLATEDNVGFISEQGNTLILRTTKENRTIVIEKSYVGKITKDNKVIYQTYNYVLPNMKTVDWFTAGKEGFKIKVTNPITNDEAFINYSSAEYKLEDHMDYLKGITNS